MQRTWWQTVATQHTGLTYFECPALTDFFFFFFRAFIIQCCAHAYPWLSLRRRQGKSNKSQVNPQPVWGEFTCDRWIPRTMGQWRGKYFHLMTSSWTSYFHRSCMQDNDRQILRLLTQIANSDSHIDGLVQDCSNSIANALALLQSCTKPSICTSTDLYSQWSYCQYHVGFLKK